MRWGKELNPGSNVVDMLSNMFWQMIFLASRHYPTRNRVLILEVLRVEEALSFLGSGIKREPAFVVRVTNSIRWYTTPDEPFSNFLLRLLGGAEGLNYLLGGPVLPKSGRRWIGSAEYQRWSSKKFLVLTLSLNGRIHSQYLSA